MAHYRMLLFLIHSHLIFYIVCHFSNVLSSGRVCALNIAGKKTEIRSVPFFWTALFGKSLRYTGKVFLICPLIRLSQLIYQHYFVRDLILLRWA